MQKGESGFINPARRWCRSNKQVVENAGEYGVLTGFLNFYPIRPPLSLEYPLIIIIMADLQARQAIPTTQRHKTLY